jgi:predicted ester cyclase
MKMTIDEMVVEGSTVAMRYTSRGTHSGPTPTLGIPPTGAKTTTAHCTFVHFKEGKIVKQWDLEDTLGLLQQLGVVPPASELSQK